MRADLGLEPAGRMQAPREAVLIPREAPGAGRVLALLGLLYAIFGATCLIYGTFIVTTLVEEYAFGEGTAGMFWSWVGFFSIFSGVGFGPWAMFVSVVLYGLGMFAIPTILAAAVGDYLGLSRAAAFSLLTFCFAIGQPLGPSGAGMLAEAVGGFAPAYLLSAASTALAALLTGLLPKPAEPH